MADSLILVNVNPFKSNVSSLGYPLTDLVFLVLINLLYISLPGRDIASMKGHDCVPLCYYSIIPIRQYTLRIVHYAPLDMECGRELLRSYRCFETH